MIRIENLRKVYSSGDEALQGVSFAVEGANLVSIIGPSGAGKSTLVRCMNRLTEPTAGRVYLDGTDLTELDTKDLRRIRRDIGMIFQEYALVERLTVMENVLSGRLGYTGRWQSFRRSFDSEDIERAYELLDEVGLAGHENDRADELSGGQRQRVGIARAVMQQPKLLLADEPTSSLDPETSHTVLDILTDIAETENIPVLMNIHEVPLAREYSNRILGLHDGELVFDGAPEELDEIATDHIYRGGTEPAIEDVSSGSSTTDTNSGRSEVTMTTDESVVKQ